MRYHARSRGFTLTELMAVIAIMSILATLGIAAFQRRAFASSVPQAQVILKAIGVAEEQYRSLNQTYLNVTSTAPATGNAGWYPVPAIAPNTKVSFVNTTHVDWDPDPTNPLGRKGWRTLNVVVNQPVGFVFKVHAGLPSNPLPALATSKLLLDAAAPTEPWYVAQARADADGDGVFCDVVATSFTPEARSVDDGE